MFNSFFLFSLGLSEEKFLFSGLSHILFYFIFRLRFVVCFSFSFVFNSILLKTIKTVSCLMFAKDSQRKTKNKFKYILQIELTNLKIKTKINIIFITKLKPSRNYQYIVFLYNCLLGYVFSC